MRHLALLLVLLGAPAAASPPLVAALKDQTWGDGDCGSELHRRGGRRKVKFLAVKADDPKHALVNVRGQDVIAVREGDVPATVDRVGARYRERWRAAGVVLDIEYVITRVCPSGGDSGDCEGVDVAATVRATDGKRSQTITARGHDGC